MEAVNAFNMELFSMIDLKPPISRAKMMSVTKSAIKAIKFYKHVVQIVEKFIKKCKPELKVPGLYVVDSIVRQSRHQFGVDKDVFGPRFLKNFTDTFQNLYSCPDDDKSKIVRVLNLWQKNGVFEMDILQPLMDMSHDAVAPSPALKVPIEPQPEVQPTVTSATHLPATQQLATHDALAAVAQLISSSQGQELQRLLQNLQQADKNLSTIISDNLPTAPQLSTPQLNSHNNAGMENKGSFAEKLLDRFDYDDEPEDVRSHELTGHTQWTTENTINNFNGQMPNTGHVFPHMMAPIDGFQVSGAAMGHMEHVRISDGHRFRDDGSNSQGNSREGSTHEGRHRGYGRRTQSRSRSRSPRRSSRSSSHSRRLRQRRSRSRSRDRRRRSTSEDQNERQKDRERRQKGLPSLKKETLNVCSTTLWVGQLDKKTQQSDVMSLFEEFGQIVSINMIPPRGCAYIVMVHRQDAYTALKRLSRGSYKVHQKPVKVAWALNKGIKAAHKKLWDVDEGVTCIPWSKVKVEELESYREGGILDMETLNPEWNISQDINKQPIENGELESVPADGMIPTQIQVPAVEQVEPIRSPAFSSPIMMSPTAVPAGGAVFNPTDPATLTTATGFKSQEEPISETTRDKNHPPHSRIDTRLPSSPIAPPISLPGPPMMPGPRPNMPPMPRPHGIPNPHLPPFFSPQNRPHMPPRVLPGGPMFAADRFRMPPAFSPPGPPFQRFPPMRPEQRFFQNASPGFGPPFPSGRWR